ncbi:hypothetical protein [Sorangium sp. So ce542]|uniref:hypothetical protein n=1 Tax=Sorangium sp. So ce542 TaxID=3133316 RepID=UPI003F5F898E
MHTLSSSPIPAKLRVFVLDASTWKPLARVPIRLSVTVRGAKAPTSVATLATDHAGYASFELSALARLGVQREIAGVWLDPYLDEEQRVDLTPQWSDGSVSAGAIPVPIAHHERRIDPHARSLPSILDPDPIDWKTSPASFGSPPTVTVGQGECESLWPSSATERLFRFHQLARRPALDAETMPHFSNYATEFPNDPEPPLQFRRGALLEYEMTWQPINHGLGQVLYSLTLAPCESVNLAVIDWSRDDRAGRTEGTIVDENLLHQQRRDRLIEESVEATLQEWQSGESFLGGTAGTGGYGGGGYGQMWGVTGSHSLGYATATTNARRDVEADTVQRLTDKVGQASSASRGLRSTVIVQAAQAERDVVQTRTVTNHNHCHALTILYYEVVRHYAVRTRFVGEQEVLFVRYDVEPFDLMRLRRHRRILSRVLLEPSLASAFRLLDEPLDEDLESLRLLKEGAVSTLFVRVTMGRDGLGAPARLRLLVLRRDGTIAHVAFSQATREHFAGDQPFFQSDPSSPTVNSVLFSAASGQGFNGLTLPEIQELGLTFDVQGDAGGQERFDFARMEVKAVVQERGEAGSSTPPDHRRPPRTRLVDLLDAREIPFFMNDTEWWSRPNQMPDIDAMFQANLAKKRRIDELVEHLNDHAVHYNAALWMNENPNERAIRFENYVYTQPGSEGASAQVGRLVEFIENVPLGVLGPYVAFRASRITRFDGAIAAERIISLPTRGAFAESKLSHCNGCEEIDDTRFWDWQQSPCARAPEIGGIAPGSRARPVSADPSPVPAPSIGVERPEPAPEPVGLREVMALLRTPEVFRDMSGIGELRPLLEKLVEVAGEVEKARIAKLDANYQRGQSGEGGAEADAGGGAGAPEAARPSSTTRDPVRRAQAAQRQIQSAQRSGLITDDEAHDLTRRALEQAVSGDEPPSDLIDSPEARELIETATHDGSDVSISDGVRKLDIERSKGDGQTSSEGEAAPLLFSSSDEINAYFRDETGEDFIPWFNGNVGGRDHWSAHRIATDADTAFRFTAIWDNIPALFGTDEINLNQFAALVSIFINENPQFNTVAEAPRTTSIAYFYERREIRAGRFKRSYNTYGSNWTAFACFNDDDFIEAHGALSPGSVLRGTSDRRWRGDVYPRDPERRWSDRRDPERNGFIMEADFFKFRGRGFNQITFRSAHLLGVRELLRYTGSDEKLVRYKTAWEALIAGSEPQSRDLHRIANRSSNADWDDLFDVSGGEVAYPLMAMRAFYKRHDDESESPLRIPEGRITSPRVERAVRRLAARQGGHDYEERLYNRTRQIIDALRR